ncbi:MAG TPA: helix-turn-helix domain-containing protein [Acidimicrobiales bacterium]
MPVARKAAASRAALIDAAVDSLVALGYRGTTTTAVCERAGVTSGALFGQFHNKEALLAAAEDQLIMVASAEIAAELTSLGNHPAASAERGLGALVDRLEAAYVRPMPAALAELWVIARTDRRLARALHEADGRILALVQAALGRLVPRLATDTAVVDVVRFVHAAARTKAAWTLLAAGGTGGGDPTGRGYRFDRAISSLASGLGEETPVPRPILTPAQALVATLRAGLVGARSPTDDPFHPVDFGRPAAPSVS